MSGLAPTIRRATEDDWVDLQHRPDDLSLLNEGFVVQDAGRSTLVGGISSRGPATDPETPRIVLAPVPDRFDVRRDLPFLIEPLIEQARRLGIARLMVGWDPMDPTGLKILEEAGFRPTGQMPYFSLGGGEVQFVTGYTDATGSTMDLVLTTH